jgi:hypothetical protein
LIDEVRQWHGSSKAMMVVVVPAFTHLQHAGAYLSANNADTDVSYTNIFSVQFPLLISQQNNTQIRIPFNALRK